VTLDRPNADVQPPANLGRRVALRAQTRDLELAPSQTYMSQGSLPLTEGMDVVVSRITVIPGGSSGWHSHPGGAIAIVQQGELTLYEAVGNHCDVTVYTAGQTFVERPNDVVNAVNTGSTNFIVVATFPGVPVGGSSRIDRPNPGTCPGV
jgi:quercetin dioxygenase-like cupin family protein